VAYEPPSDTEILFETLFDIRRGVYHVIDLLEDGDEEEEKEDEP
jgi:hypothetical protein